MARQRPRRALRPPLAVRIGRIAVPAALVTLMSAGVAVAAWPESQSITALPAPVSSPSATSAASIAGTGRDQRVSRASGTRPELESPDQSDAAPSAKAGASKRASAEKQSPAAKKIAPTPKSSPAKKPVTAKKSKTAQRSTSSRKSAGTTHSSTPAVADPQAVGTRFVTVDLNVRTRRSASATLITVLERGDKASVTNTTTNGWRLIVNRGTGGWVKKQYLSTTQPKAPTAGPSSQPCAGGSAVEAGLTSDAIRVHRALCARYPQITSYGGVRSDSNSAHSSGRALDAMISNSAVGWQIAEWVRANALRLGVSEVIYSQRIWTVQRGSEGWRSMSDRGSVSANHYDHVHVTV